MYKKDYNLWVRYHKGQINRELTEEEYKDIKASDFAMHFLVPTKALIQECGGLSAIENADFFNDYYKVFYLANIFCVPIEVIQIKLEYILKEIEKAKERKQNAKLVRKIQLKKKEIAMFGECIK